MGAKDDCNQLLDATVPRAENLLREHGEFFPFGAQMLPSGEIVQVAAYAGGEQPPSQDLIDLLQTSFKTRACYGEVVATALVYDVGVTPPGSDRKSDAIAVNLDHQNNYSVTVFFPYVIANGEPALGEAFGNIGENSVFPLGSSSEA
jgi:hypothetical protein